jgi:putative ubiquitin-RnfH superfamily antitoxin RatB of RatAB toxin-antitoxin module
MPRLRVEVTHVQASGEERRRVELEAGATAAEAVTASGLLEARDLPEGWALGVAGQRVGPDYALADGERVDILRPLAMDPREARRLRAQRTRRRR